MGNLNRREPKKKAAILTWCNTNGPTNYGQILQCYAVQKIVENWGYDAFVINYRKKTSSDVIQKNFSYKHLWGRKLNQCYENIFFAKVLDKSPRAKLFQKFVQNNINLTAPCYTKEAVEYETRNCDLLVCGSDQIWNPIWTDSVFYLGFGRASQKRIAYAASGIFSEEEKNIACYKEMTKYLNNIDVISMREEKGARILSKYVQQNIKVVLDPTMMLSRQEWDRIASDNIVKEDYVFCYLLGGLRASQLIIKALQEKYQALKVIYISSNLVPEEDYPNVSRFDEAGPDDFLTLIKNAKVILTDSFHGVAFSILYGKQFYSVSKRNIYGNVVEGEERIENLLEDLDIESRKVANVKDIMKKKEITYKEVEKKLESLRRENIKFWNDMMSSR